MWSAGIFLSNTLPSFRNPGGVDGVPEPAQPPTELVLWIDPAVSTLLQKLLLVQRLFCRPEVFHNPQWLFVNPAHPHGDV